MSTLVSSLSNHPYNVPLFQASSTLVTIHPPAINNYQSTRPSHSSGRTVYLSRPGSIEIISRKINNHESLTIDYLYPTASRTLPSRTYASFSSEHTSTGLVPGLVGSRENSPRHGYTPGSPPNHLFPIKSSRNSNPEFPNRSLIIA